MSKEHSLTPTTIGRSRRGDEQQRRRQRREPERIPPDYLIEGGHRRRAAAQASALGRSVRRSRGAAMVRVTAPAPYP